MKQAIGNLLALGLFATTALGYAAERSVSYSYNAQGLIASVDGPRTDVADITLFEYDSQGNRTAVINALGHTTRISAYDTAGRPLTTIDANGLVTQLAYDARGRVVRTDKGGEVTQLSYDAVGNLIATTQADGSVMHMTYDDARRLIAISDSIGNRIDYTVDVMGNRTRTEVSDSSGQLRQLHQAMFDELSRLLQSIGADNATTTYSYDANDNTTGITDAQGGNTQSNYDALNRLVSQLDPLGGAVSYGYDAQDNLTSVTDANGNITTYDYDGLGNLIAQHSPDTGTITFTHDAAGNVLTKTDAKGQIITFNYDALNRLTRTLYADLSEVVYEYDTASNGIGRLARIIDSSGENTWSYDLHGRTTARTQTITLDSNTQTLSTAWKYNTAGQLERVTYPSGMQVGYNYTDGQISGVTVNGQPLLSAIRYQPFGPVSGWQWANGTQSSRGYDLDGRLISQQLGNSERNLSYDMLGNITTITDPANTQVFDYDALSRLTGANDTTMNLAWQYDANGNRLSEMSDGILTSYSIDALSNRSLAIAEQTRLYDINGNLVSDGEHSYQYDIRERLMSVDEGAVGSYRYNALGQRVYKWGLLPNSATPDLNGDGEVTNADIHVLHDYIRSGEAPSWADLNGDGVVNGKDTPCIATLIGKGKSYQQGKGHTKEVKSRKGKTHGRHACLPPVMPQERLFAYDEHRLLGEYNLQGSAEQETVWLNNIPVATVQNGTLYNIHADHLGAPRVITDNANIEVWRWDADPFGTAAANDDPDGDGNKLSYNLRFPGQYYDAETEKHYNYFRDYDPSTGRYTTSDPIGLSGGLNTYTYVSGNPLVRTDPLGLRGSYCQRPLGDYSGLNGSGPPVFNHQFICVTLANGSVKCDSNNNPDSDTNPMTPAPGVPSRPDRDNESVAQCENIDDDTDRCFEDCVLKQWTQPRPNYAIGPLGTDCQEYSGDIVQICSAQCK